VVLRVALGVLVMLVAIGSLLVAGQSAEAGSEVGRSPVVQRIVLPGETLWQIAGEVAPDVDRRETIATIVELNSLDSAGVSAGQRITVPVGSGSGRG
jgi:Tfp pilus assembly protein FimV